MSKLSTTEKKEIRNSWKDLLDSYTLYKPFHFIKRNGPILLGVYLKPVGAGAAYCPEFHTHSLMTLFPVISLGSVLSLCNHKHVPDAISYKRHQNEFGLIAENFKIQFPDALIQTATCSMIDRIYHNSIANYMGYPHDDMKNHILFLHWCRKEEYKERLIEAYKNIIRAWPVFVKAKIDGEEGWEKEVRANMDINKLENNVDAEVEKFKLNKLVDYGLLFD